MPVRATEEDMTTMRTGKRRLARVAFVTLSVLIAPALSSQPWPGPAPRPKQAGFSIVAAAFAADEVDCLLPSQVRRLGGTTYVSRRQTIRTSPQDCAQRGGEFVVYDVRDPEGRKAAERPPERLTRPPVTKPDPVIAAQQQEIDELKSRLAKYEKQTQAVRESRQKQAVTVRVKEKAVDTAEKEVVQDQRALTELKEQVDRQRSELDRLRAEGQRIVAEQTKVRNEGTLLAAERARLQNKITADRSASEQERAELRTLEQRAQATQNEVKALQVRLEQQQAMLTKGETDLASREKVIKTKEAELSAREKEVASKQAEVDRLNEELWRLNEQVREQQSKLGFIKDQESLQAERQQIEKEKRDLDRARAENARLTAEQAKLREQSTRLAEERSRLVEKIGADRKASEKERNELKRLEQLSRKKEGEAKAVEARLDEKQQDLARGEARLSARESAMNVKDAQLLVREQELDAREKEIAEKQKQLAELSQGALRSLEAVDVPLKPASPWSGFDFGNYHALVIGNNRYERLPKLETAVADAEKVAEVLEAQYGFKVTLIGNANRYDILKALNELRETLTESDNLLIYYAGHGEIDRKNQRGYWLPVDAEPDSNANWISNIAVTDIINTMSARHVMVVADSCYSGSLTRSALARLDPGMGSEARLKWIRSMVGKPSRTALTSGGVKPVVDNIGGPHSIFAQAFIEVLAGNSAALEGHRLFREISARVAPTVSARGLDQTPEYAPIRFSGHAGGDFFFVPQG